MVKLLLNNHGYKRYMLDIYPNAPPPSHVRARGEVTISCRSNGLTTTLNKLRQAGSLKCFFPKTCRNELQAVLLNSAGGLTGGDQLIISARVEPQAQLTITSQAAERIYRTLDNHESLIRTELHVSNNAHLNWVPQETILFEGCALRRSLTVTLEETSSLIIIEPIVFGRREMGETLTSISLNDRIEIYRSGQPIFIDVIQMFGDAEEELDKPSVANGARTVTSVTYIASDAEAHLAGIRQLLPQEAGASLFHSDTLVMRLIAKDSNDMRKWLIPILDRLTQKGLPKCWSL